MSPFVPDEELDLVWIDGVNWRLKTPFDYHTLVTLPCGPTIEIPAGFVTDFASTKRALWTLYPPTGRYGPAALVHDYLYRTPYMATRAEADAVFREAMQCLGVSAITRWLFYTGVRAFGASSYKGRL